ncbi:sodium/proline symporter PutP [Spongorhabdus nitratireducens]
MSANNLTVVLTFAVYFVVMLAIGVIAWKRTVSSTDYFLGGRSLGPWTSALSAGASDMSGWLLLGLPGYAFAAGFEAFWLAGGLLLGTWLNWLLVAGRLREYSVAAGNSLTLSEFFANRFKDRSGLLQPVSAFFILLFFLFYTASGLVAAGKLFETVFSVNYQWAVIFGTLSVVSYTLFGGFLAVCWTDLVQGLLMAAALVIVPVIAVQMAGGGGQLLVNLEQINPHLLNPMTSSTGEAIDLVVIISLLGWGLGYFGQPHIIARFKATRSTRDITIARRIAVSWTGVGMVGALLTGLAGLIYTRSLGVAVDDAEAIFMLLVNSLFHPVVAGILLAAILAAVMSTADSQLLVCSTAFAEDFYKDIFRPEASSREVIRVGQLAVVIVAILATLIALDPDSSVLGMVSYAWAGFGAAFGPALLMSLFWQRMTEWGALSGIVTGGVTVLLWKPLSGGIFDLYELVPGFILASVAVYLVSCLGPRPATGVEELFGKITRGPDNSSDPAW